jgi:predicted amidohydrolase
VHVVLGMNERDPRPGCETVYNTLLYINREGSVVGRHRKLLPTFVERVFWGQGDGRDIFAFDTDIGRISGLICGENCMPLARAAMIAQGHDIHIAVFPGSFAAHTGPTLQEPDSDGMFWGHFACRTHTMESGAFVVCACDYLDAKDIPEGFPHHDRMNFGYAHGGSAVYAPLGVPLVEPTFGSQIVYADLDAVMIKASKAFVDTIGHYGRPDVFQLLVRRDRGWEPADVPVAPARLELDRNVLRRAADRHEVAPELIEQVAEPVLGT